jgi:hypothetical protein
MFEIMKETAREEKADVSSLKYWPAAELTGGLRPNPERKYGC